MGLVTEEGLIVPDSTSIESLTAEQRSLVQKFMTLLGFRQVVVMAWNGTEVHIATHGQTDLDAMSAAEGGNLLKSLLNWPVELHAEPGYVQQLRQRIQELEEQIAQHHYGTTHGTTQCENPPSDNRKS